MNYYTRVYDKDLQKVGYSSLRCTLKPKLRRLVALPFAAWGFELLCKDKGPSTS